MKYDILLMDLDDTLLDYRTSERNVLCKVFSAFDTVYDKTGHELFRKINDGLWVEYEA